LPLFETVSESPVRYRSFLRGIMVVCEVTNPEHDKQENQLPAIGTQLTDLRRFGCYICGRRDHTIRDERDQVVEIVMIFQYSIRVESLQDGYHLRVAEQDKNGWLLDHWRRIFQHFESQMLSLHITAEKAEGMLIPVERITGKVNIITGGQGCKVTRNANAISSIVLDIIVIT